MSSSSSLVAIFFIISILPMSISSDEKRSTSSPTPFTTSVRAMCDATLYPDSCVASISPMANSAELDPADLFSLSVQVGVDRLSMISRQLEHIRWNSVSINDTMIPLVFSSCNELVELAMNHLNDCSRSATDFGNEDLVEDVRTWLSSALTYLQTCIGGFENSADLSSEISVLLKNSTEAASNSLDIFTNLNAMFGSGVLRRRLMNFDSYEEKTPSWLSSKDRKLFQPANDPRENADIVVAKDGTGEYKTIEEALKAVPGKNEKRTVIYLKTGVYYENVRVEPNMWNVMIVGDGKDLTVVSGSLNYVDGTPTIYTATFAAIGTGFIARDMGFRNTAGPAKHQAVALRSASDRSTFYKCSFDAYQDTLYAHANRQFYKECDVYGTVDFIFGNGAVVLQQCNILPRVPLHGQQDTITAQGKYLPNQNTGISIHECTITPFGDLSSVNVFLGRPWKPYSTTVFMKSSMAGFIHPDGWMPWTGNDAPPTIFYGEFENFGAGASTKNRVKWKGLRKMDGNIAGRFTVESFIHGRGWIGKARVPYKPGRPWKPYSTTVFMKSSMAGFIHPDGWMPWTGNDAPPTIFYGEFENFGAGASTKNRVKWKGLRKMDGNIAGRFTVESFIHGRGWIGKARVPYKPGL